MPAVTIQFFLTLRRISRKSRAVKVRPIHTTIIPTLPSPSVESESDAPPACDALLRALGDAAIAW